MHDKTASKTLSIRDALNAIAADMSDSAQQDTELFSAPDFTDIAQWIAIDPDILGLYKSHLDARAEYIGILTTHGAASPLSEIAAERADSLWCALETRLYELRMDRAAQARKALAQKLEAESARARTLQAEQARRTRHESRTARDLALRHRQNEEKQRRAFFFLFWYWCLFVVGTRFDPPLPAATLSRTFAAA